MGPVAVRYVEHGRGRPVLVLHGADVFRNYFVIQTPEMLDRYEHFVVPSEALVDEAALERIGKRWVLDSDDGPAYAGPTLIQRSSRPRR